MLLMLCSGLWWLCMFMLFIASEKIKLMTLQALPFPLDVVRSSELFLFHVLER